MVMVLPFWSVQLYKASGIRDNAGIYSISTLVEYFNQNLFVDISPQKIICNIHHYEFVRMIVYIKKERERERESYPEIY